MINTVDIIRLSYLLILVIAAAYTDVSRDKIYNWMVIPSLILGPLFALNLGGVNQGDFNLVNSLVGMCLGGLLLGIFFLLGQMGGGDVKLMAAIGGLVGFPFIIRVLFYSSLAGAIIGLAVIAWHRQRLLVVMRNIMGFLRLKSVVPADAKPEALTIPFGLAIAIGTMWAYCLVLAR